MIYEFNGHRPVVHISAFVHPQAVVTGNVYIGRCVYIGPGASIRGDWGRIVIEDGCNVQENCTIHMFPGVTVLLKEGAHIGHGAIVHGAVIGYDSLIGMNAVVMDNAEIGDECIIGALSFIKAGEKIPRRSVVAGNPAKIIKEVSDEMLKWKGEGTSLYQALPDQMWQSLKAIELEIPRIARRKEIPPEDAGAAPTYRPWKETGENQQNLIEEPAAAYKRPTLTIDEYLEMEEKSDVKHEFYKGQVYSMSGPKLDHLRITGNLSALLRQKLRGSGCEVFTADLRVFVESEELLTYPDLSITCGELLTRDNDDWNLTNPSVLVEVLSKSTMKYDRNEKFELYKGIPSLREYILIDSRSVSAEQFCKNGEGQWVMKKYENLTDNMTVETVKVDLPLAAIYEDLRFLKVSD